MSIKKFLDFERSIAELEEKIEELRHLTSGEDLNIADEISRLEKKMAKSLQQIYSNLTPWQKVQVARHPVRPHFKNYLNGLITDFIPLAGDRCFAEDKAIISGLGRLRGRPVMVMGHQKGHETEERLYHNFGMPKPEGYRKARRLMEVADRFNLPLVMFVDTAGAMPGVEAEERGQAESIARAIETSLTIGVPIVSVIIGEGGSGGAIALGVANEILMLEHAIYSVISPEGCAGILWRSRDFSETAAAAQRLTAQDLYKLGVIDLIIEEPLGGAHRDYNLIIQRVGDQVVEALGKYDNFTRQALVHHRRDKFLAMGARGL